MTQESLPRRVFSGRVLRYSHMKRDSADWKAPKIAGLHAGTDQNQLILPKLLSPVFPSRFVTATA